MEDGGRVGAGAGLAVPLLPPGSDIVNDESPAPLLPLLGPTTVGGAADAEAAAVASFRRALPPHHYHHQQRRKKPLHWAVAGLILFGFCAPAALVTVPFAMGTAGLLLGLVALVVLTTASALGALMLLEIYLAHPWSQNLPELGEAAMGRLGKRLAATCQMCNFVGFLPVALFIAGGALQGVVGAPADSCLDGYILAVAAVCFVTTQARVLSNTQALALLSLTAIAAAACLQLGIVFTHDNPERVPPQLIGHPGPLTATEAVRTLLALTCFAWSYVPSFLLVELASGMPHPRQLPRSLALAALLTALLFLGVGTAVALRWGWALPDPVTALAAWPRASAAARAMQGLLLLGNVVTYALDSVPLARFCQRAWLPHFKDDWSPRSILTYAGLSLPTFLFGVIAALVVGNLLVLLAFVSALSVPWVTQLLPALFYYRWRQRLAAASASSALGGPGGPGGGGNWGFFSSLSSLTDDGPASSLLLPPPLTSLWPAGGGVAASAASWLLPRGGRVAPLSRKEKAVVCLVGGVGVLNFLVCAGAAVGKVAIKELRGETVIGCGSWTVYSDAG